MIHEYIEEKATDRITWIIIWLIVVACFVEVVSCAREGVVSVLTSCQGEVAARLIFHAIPRKQGEFLLVKGSKMLVDTAIKGASV